MESARLKIFPDTSALRLGKYLGQTPQFWMNLQSSFDMQTAEIQIGAKMKKIQPHFQAA
ncbi:MAG: addiction module antidote protein, HigA family [Nitrospirae bacterium]|nr:addiction module antidote protein, HigA family [Nitrospirota bacterium]